MGKFKVISKKDNGVMLIEPAVFQDCRGYFSETYNRADLAEIGIVNDFIQDNESLSSYGVVRGLHFQTLPYTQAKLVRVISGRVLDVAVDIRRNSPDFGRIFTAELSGENHRQFYIPRGFAHGFAVLSETALFAYKCDNIYHPASERGIAFDDPELAIDWQIPADKMILAAKDLKHPAFKDAEVFDASGENLL